jgi:hypothetical protein
VAGNVLSKEAVQVSVFVHSWGSYLHGWRRRADCKVNQPRQTRDFHQAKKKFPLSPFSRYLQAQFSLIFTLTFYKEIDV